MMFNDFKTALSDKRLLYLIYPVLIFLATPKEADLFVKISFWLFSLFLMWLLWIGDSKKSKAPKTKIRKINKLWILLPLGILIITRIIPFIHWGETPLGYDTGIYSKTFENCFAKLDKGGCAGNPITFIANILFIIGWETKYILSVFYIILNIFAGLLIYITAKEYLNEKAAFFSFLIFSLSASQFLMYWWFYWSMMTALVFTLAALYLLKKESWLVVPVAGFIGVVHPLSFLPFGLAMILFFIFNKEKWYVFWSGLGIILVAFSVNFKTFLGYLPFYTEKGGLIKDYPEYLAQELTGQFINFNLYRGLVLFYLAFAIIGLLELLKNKKYNYLFFYFLVNFAIVYGNIIFHNRYIILLDVIAIIFAGITVSNFTDRLWSFNLGKIAVILLLVTGIFGSIYQSIATEPLIKKEELQEIKSLSSITEPNAYVMVVTSYYSPWVYGYSNRKTIAPGLFEHDKWDLMKWKIFWSTSNINIKRKLLDEYDKPLYIYVGDVVGKMSFKNDPGFQKVSKRVWKYIGSYYLETQPLILNQNATP